MSFQHDFRRCQERFLATSKTIAPHARTCQDPKGIRNKYLLPIGCEEQNLIPCLRDSNGAMSFFSVRGIQWWKSSRSGDDCSRNTPTRNLASSQVSCVNFLMPPSRVPGALEAMLRLVDADVEAVEPLTYNGQVSNVEFEWIGLGASLEGRAGTRGANVTSADALIVARTRAGRRAYVIEWKGCEQYFAAKFLGEGSPGKTRRRRYKQLYEATSSPFNNVVPFDELLYDPFYQLMRLFLLGDRMVREREFGVTDFRVLVVCPQENTIYRDTITSPGLRGRFPSASVAETLRRTLRDPNRLQVTCQASLLNAVRSASCSASLTEWDRYHHERYGW